MFCKRIVPRLFKSTLSRKPCSEDLKRCAPINHIKQHLCCFLLCLHILGDWEGLTVPADLRASPGVGGHGAVLEIFHRAALATEERNAENHDSDERQQRQGDAEAAPALRTSHGLGSVCGYLGFRCATLW